MAVDRRRCCGGGVGKPYGRPVGRLLTGSCQQYLGMWGRGSTRLPGVPLREGFTNQSSQVLLTIAASGGEEQPAEGLGQQGFRNLRGVSLRIVLWSVRDAGAGRAIQAEQRRSLLLLNLLVTIKYLTLLPVPASRALALQQCYRAAV